MEKIPVTIITGFLGAGKTSLIQNLLETAQGKKIALIINEFGEFGVDGSLLKGCGLKKCTKEQRGALLQEEDIIELSNGCICCTVADDFIPVMTKLLNRDDVLDHIVIETSGLALPQPLIDAFQWPFIKTQTRIDSVIAVVDGVALKDGEFVQDKKRVEKQRRADQLLEHETPLEHLFQDQIDACDIIVLNKVDGLNAEEISKIEQELIERKGQSIKIIKSCYGNVSALLLLDLNYASHVKTLSNFDDHHESHDHDFFQAYVLEGGIVRDRKIFEEKLKQRLEEQAILRVKGFVKIKNKMMPLVVQAVGRRFDSYFSPQSLKIETKDCKNISRLVVISGGDLDIEAFQKDLFL